MKRKLLLTLIVVLAAVGIYKYLTAGTSGSRITYTLYAEGGEAWLTGWDFRKEVPLPTPTGNLTDVPCRISLVANADFHEARADGFDIRITEDDGETLCKYEREYWSGGGGAAATAEIWAKAPSVLAAGGNKLYIYYGKADAGDGEDAANVWDANFMAVWHLKEDGDGTPGEFKDSSGNANHGQGMGTVGVPAQVDGKIGKGQDFEFDSKQYIGIPDDNSLDVTSLASVSCWVKTETAATNKVAVHLYAPDQGTHRLFVDNSEHVWLKAEIGGVSKTPISTGTVTSGVWSQIGWVYDGANAWTFLDGAKDSSIVAATGDLTVSDLEKWIGRGQDNDVYDFDGVIDEVRISNINRSEAWIGFTYTNINTPPTLEAEEINIFDNVIIPVIIDVIIPVIIDPKRIKR